MFRRVRLGWSERMGSDIAHDVAREVRDEMGWSPAEVAGEAISPMCYDRRCLDEGWASRNGKP